MIEQRGQELIVGSLAAAVVVSAGSQLAEGKGFHGRSVIGFLAVGVGLATVNMFSPDLAGGMAVLVLVTTVFVYGGPAFDALSKATAPAATTTKAT